MFVQDKSQLVHLLTPFTGKLSLNNRIVMAPMTRRQSINNIPGSDVAEYYTRRARGGVGLIITEGTCVDHAGAHGYLNVPSFFGEAALCAWQQVVNSVHQAGGKIVPQLWHVGSVRQKGQPPEESAESYGPTPDIIHPYVIEKQSDPQPPVGLSEQDIADIIAAFAKGAKAAQELGFDGVELHGAHGYLIDQFFWSHTNKRQDSYGGDLIARTRFACEIIKAIRVQVGPNFPILFRFSQWKLGDFKHKLAATPEALSNFLEPLAHAGVDIFHCSTRRYETPEFPESDPIRNLAGWTKQITGLPTITVGSVGLDSPFTDSLAQKNTASASIDNLLTRLHDKEFDLVAIGRALIADPYLVQKLKEDRFEDIIPFQPECLASYH